MKQQATLYLLLFILSNLGAQNWSLGAKWIYTQDEFIPNQGLKYRTFLITGDTTIQGQFCSILNEKLSWVMSNGITEYPLGRHFLSQNGAKIAFFDADSQQFIPLYDFDKTVGDTVFSYCLEAQEPVACIIDSIYYQVIGGQSRKVQRIQGYSGSCYISGNNYEGIGNDRYLFARPGFVDPPPGGSLFCFSDSTTTFPTGVNCSLLVKTTDLSASTIETFPNPTSGRLSFSKPDDIDNIRVFNALGELVRNLNVVHDVSLHALPDGLYWLHIETSNGVFSKKIIKKSL